ncbi:hypothetical protein GX586_14005 [bacterium]|nr:hypothetical protein [bacterium]
MKIIRTITTAALVAATCCAAQEVSPAPAPASPAVAALERQVAAQKDRVTDLAGEMVELDNEIERSINRVVSYLLTITDSMDSGVRVTDMKMDAIKKLRNSIEYYQRLRSMRITALNARYSSVPKDALADDVSRLDQRINERAEQIVEITTSLSQHQDFNKYVYYRNYHSSSVHRRVTKEYKHDRDVASRSETARESVINGLRDSIQNLEDDNSRLRRQLASAPASQHAALRARIEANSQAIDTLNAKIDGILTAQQPPQKALGLKEAGDVERLIHDATCQIQDMHDQLMKLDTQRDAELATLATLELRLKNARAAAASGR